MERVHDHDARKTALGKPVMGPRPIHQSGIDQQSIEGPVHTKHFLDANRTDKGRKYQRNQHEHAQNFLALEVIFMRQQGQRKGQQQGGHGANKSQQKSIPQALHINRFPAHRDKILQGETAVLVPKCLADDLRRRIEEEHPEQHQNEHHDRIGISLFHGVIRFRCALRAICSALLY